MKKILMALAALTVISPAFGQLGNAKQIWSRTIAPTAPSNLQCLVWVSARNRWEPGSCAAAGSGTVTSVGFTGGIVSVANPTTTPAFTVAGTSGGLVYFSDATHWASTPAAMGAGQFVLGGGAGTTPTTSFSVVTVAKGGTSFSSYTKGDTICPSGSTTLTKLAVGTDAQVLTADAASTCGIKWADASSGSGNVSTAVTLTSGLPVIGAGTSAIAVGTRSGNTTAYVTTTGTQTASDCVSIDASGNHVANGAACLSAAALAGVYVANAGSNTILAGTGNLLTSSATKSAAVLVPVANPSAPAAGSISVDLAGAHDWYSGSAWRYAVSGASDNDLTALSTGIMKVTTTTGAITSVATSGSGSVCLTTSCVMTTPNLGTPSALVLTSATGLPSTSVLPTTLATGTSVSLPTTREYYVCTSTCTVTPPVPAAGSGEFCVRNANNSATVITLAALGSSARYEAQARTSYGTAGTGTFVSGGAATDQVCLVGLDSTHYLIWSISGTWAAN